MLEYLLERGADPMSKTQMGCEGSEDQAMIATVARSGSTRLVAGTFRSVELPWNRLQLGEVSGLNTLEMSFSSSIILLSVKDNRT